MDKLKISESDRILIIAPHPDDEAIGAGGLLCKYRNQVSVMVLSDGAAGIKDLCKNNSASIRRNEFEEEMRSLEIRDYNFLNIEDGSLMSHLDYMASVDLSEYSKIFVTSDEDGHLDHTAAFYAVQKALVQQKLQKRVQLYTYEVHNMLSNPTHMLDITDVIEQKENLILYHQSQIKVIPYERQARINSELRGLQNRMTDKFLEVYKHIDFTGMINNVDVSNQKDLQKFKRFYQVLTRWLLADSPDNFAVKLKQKAIYEVAIYGYAELGQITYKYLSQGDIKVSYIIDRGIKSDCKEIPVPVFKPEQNLPPVDAIIVTAISAFAEIKEDLLQKSNNKILSLEDLII